MSVQDVLRVSGRLCVGPTQNGLLGAFPHGGTEVGRVSEVVVTETAEETPILGEARGKVAGLLRGISTVLVAAVLLERNPTGYGLVYRTTTTSGGGFSGAKTIRGSAPGLVTATSPILFSPDDPAHPGVLVYAPLPYVGPAGRRLEFLLRRGLEFPLLFLVGEDANGNDLAIDLLEHLSLT